jgi:Protein of unknown function (DUF2971)
MKATRVYKFRGGSPEDVDRAIDCVERDQLYAPTSAELNDPAEAILTRGVSIEMLLGIAGELRPQLEAFESMRHSTGIYSLSRDITDEVLWAHYALGHTGFCIEYDLHRLLLEPRNQWRALDVIYAETPPRLELDDFTADDEAIAAQSKMIGHKSIRWAYERELRISTARSGINHYARDAVTAIYFGCRSSEKTQNRIRNTLKGRRIRYFRMELQPETYLLREKTLPREAIDGAITTWKAPVDDGAIPDISDVGENSAKYEKLLRAIEIVRADSSCEAIVNADFSVNPSTRGQPYVQFRSRVPMDLDNTVTWRFQLADI